MKWYGYLFKLFKTMRRESCESSETIFCLNAVFEDEKKHEKNSNLVEKKINSNILSKLAL